MSRAVNTRAKTWWSRSRARSGWS